MQIGITGSVGILGDSIKKKLKLKNKNIFKGKIENKKNINDWIKNNDFDVIIHLAAIVPIKIVNKNKKYALKVNYYGTKNLINAINRLSKKKVWFFYASTSHVYPFKKTIIKENQKTNPLSYYCKTKLLGEKYLLKNKKKITPCVGRIFSFTSKKQSKLFIIPALISKLKSNKKIIKFTNINHFRDFISIEDICGALIILMKSKARGVYNICSGNKINIKSILYKLNKKFNKKIIIEDNLNQTTLFGSNRKLIQKGWKLSKSNYLDYIYNNS